MQVTLPPELEQIVQTYLNSGKYQNAAEILLAGVQLLQREETSPDLTFGILDEQRQFFPLTESELIQESLKVLANHRNAHTLIIKDWRADIQHIQKLRSQMLKI